MIAFVTTPLSELFILTHLHDTHFYSHPVIAAVDEILAIIKSFSESSSSPPPAVFDLVCKKKKAEEQKLIGGRGLHTPALVVERHLSERYRFSHASSGCIRVAPWGGCGIWTELNLTH